MRLLAYAGLRPQEARALRWGHVAERTLTVHAPKTRRHRAEPRSGRLLPHSPTTCVSGDCSQAVPPTARR